MPLVVAHALLHGEGAAGSALPRGHLPPACPKARPLGSRRRRTPSFRAPRTGHAVCLPGAALRGAGPRGAGLWSGHVVFRHRRPPGRAKPPEPPTPAWRVAPRGQPAGRCFAQSCGSPSPRGGLGRRNAPQPVEDCPRATRSGRQKVKRHVGDQL